jgi:hypothetical protein
MDDTTIAGEHAPLGDGDDLAEGCDAVLKMHFLYAGTDRRDRGRPLEVRFYSERRRQSRSVALRRDSASLSRSYLGL